MESSDQDWTNSYGALTPLSRNKRSYIPSSYPESFYNVRNRPNSFDSLPSCNWNSPRCSAYPNVSSEPYTGHIINRKVKFHPRRLSFGSPMRTDHKRRESHDFHPDYHSGWSGNKQSRFDPQVNLYQNVKMHPNLYTTFDYKTNVKSNQKRYRGNKLKYSKSEDATVNLGYQNVPIPDKFSSKHEAMYAKLSFGDAVTNAKLNNYNTEQEGVSTDLIFKNTATSAVRSNLNNKNEKIPADFFYRDAMVNEVTKNVESKDSGELSNCQALHRIMTEVKDFNAQDSQEENLETIEFELHKPIFEGKDENGEDIVIFIGSPNTDVIDVVKKTNLSLYYQNIGGRHNQAIQNSAAENTSVTQNLVTENNETAGNVFEENTNLSSEKFLEAQI